ncbi:hypothetical protein IFM89_017028 [Coptis chinensis]|uniref:Uncharacterized protein n=1 Tax=Coptis chinensis TaxID=261450 RepID=A0A835HQ85_9MAGN|nr:hypothetical protein IFM89_017028 [Coptis chinensis]
MNSVVKGGTLMAKEAIFNLKEMVLALLIESDLTRIEDVVETIVDKTFNNADSKGDGRTNMHQMAARLLSSQTINGRGGIWTYGRTKKHRFCIGAGNAHGCRNEEPRLTKTLEDWRRTSKLVVSGCNCLDQLNKKQKSLRTCCIGNLVAGRCRERTVDEIIFFYLITVVSSHSENCSAVVSLLENEHRLFPSLSSKSPIECGGCGSKILELRRNLKANWTSNLLKSAEKLTSNSPFPNVDSPVGCSSCLPFVGKVEINIHQFFTGYLEGRISGQKC